jgi:hypothetical protein
MSTVLASSADVVKFWSTGGEEAQPVLKSVVPLPCDSVQQISWNHNSRCCLRVVRRRLAKISNVSLP